MSISLEFINFIIPVKIIKEKYPGGWEQCLSDHADLIGGRVWYDEHLFRDGAMNPTDIVSLIERWKGLGFQTHEGGENPSKWVDVCVVEALFGGATLPCDWIEVEDHIAFLKGTSKGNVVGSEQVTS